MPVDIDIDSPCSAKLFALVDPTHPAALAELMRLRRTAQRIAVVVDGVERVLYSPKKQKAAM